MTAATVVAGVDGSPDGAAAVDVAAAEADARGVALRLVHAYTWPALLPVAPLGAYPPDPSDPRVAAEQVLAEARSRVQATHPELEVQVRAAVGAPAAVLLVEARTAAMVVVGTRGHGGFVGLLAGSTSTQVATHAQVPVLVVRGGGVPAGAPVLLGVDGDEPSVAAVEFAFEEAAHRGVALHALYGWSGRTTVAPGSPLAPPAYDFAEAEQEAHRVLAEVLAGWQEKYPQVEIERRVVHTLDAPALLVRASSHAGLVVVGSRGRGELRSLLLGGCGYVLVHRAHCPVAVVHDSPR